MTASWQLQFATCCLHLIRGNCLPRYQIGALRVLADDGRESVDAMLTRMLEELTDLNQERLARLIPGLAEAIAWPEAGQSDRPC